MIRTLLSRLALRPTARKQNKSSMLGSSESGSPTVGPTSEAEETLGSRESQQTGPPSLSTLPTELVLLVSDFLPLADALCLALTCKRMCNIAGIAYLATRLDTDATDTLLCRLERDTTKFTYCFGDQKLEPAHKNLNRHKPIGFHFHSHRGTSLERVPQLHIGASRFQLAYCTARLVTNHDLLGPRHGVPASSLARTYPHRLHRDGVCWSEVWEANMIHGELFLSCIHEFFHKEANAGALQEYFNAEFMLMCPHMAIGGGRAYCELIRLPGNVIGKTNHHDAGWCRKCETDWEVTIGWADTEHGWTVTVRTYHGLGACRSPDDPKWQAISVRKYAHREVPRGAVKDLWEQNANNDSVGQLEVTVMGQRGRGAAAFSEGKGQETGICY